MSKPLAHVRDVVHWRLCLGCGACIGACPRGALTLVDVEQDGLRPRGDVDQCAHCGQCVQVCPGIGIDKEADMRGAAPGPRTVGAGPRARPEESGQPQGRVPKRDTIAFGVPVAPTNPPSALTELGTAWGTVLEIWEGYAADPEIRFHGSSGGVATALSLFCLEHRQMQGVLHIKPSPADPLRNVPAISSNRAELLLRTGSRYAPAAPCLGLTSLDGQGQPYVFVGKPCDVVAVRKWQQTLEDGGQRTEGRGPRTEDRGQTTAPSSEIRPPSSVLRPPDRPPSSESRPFGVLISIFCAGTPSTQGTKKILERLSVAPEEVAELRYRGRGWPGRTTVTLKQATGSQLIDPGSQFPDPSSQQRRTHNCELRTDNCQLPTDNCELRTDDERSMTYEDSWGTILSKHTQFRCRLCPDSTGELADLSCGDPWYRQIDPEDPGRSLVLVRTELGRSILHGAMEAGYVQLEPAQPDTLPRSQRSLLYRRRQLWGRLAALRAFGVPVPRYRGFSLLGNWRSLPLADKLRSLLGTAHRICTRKWNRPAGSHTP